MSKSRRHFLTQTSLGLLGAAVARIPAGKSTQTNSGKIPRNFLPARRPLSAPDCRWPRSLACDFRPS